MNKKALINIVILGFLCTNVCAQQISAQKGYIHLNKHFFTAGESIQYKIYFQPVLQDEKVFSMLLIDVNDVDNDFPVDRYRTRVNAQITNGNMPIPNDIQSGKYLLVAYLEEPGEIINPFFSSPVYIHNPGIHLEAEPLEITENSTESEGLSNIILLPEGGHILLNENNKIGLYLSNNKKGVVDSAWIESGKWHQNINVRNSYTLFELHPDSVNSYYFYVLANNGELQRMKIPVSDSGPRLTLHSMNDRGVAFRIVGNSDTEMTYSLLIEHEKDLIEMVKVTLESGRSDKIITVQAPLLGYLYKASLENVSGHVFSSRYFYYKEPSVSVQIEKSKLSSQPGQIFRLSGFLEDQSGIRLNGNLSVSVVKSEFATQHQNPLSVFLANRPVYKFINDFSNSSSLNDKMICFDDMQQKEIKTIQVHNNGTTPGYISGNLYKDSIPVNLGSAFMYINNPVTVFERYFSGTDGEFYFSENDIEADYYAMLLTYPTEGNDAYFTINNPSVTDYQDFLEQFNISNQPQHYIDISDKLYQIGQSYLEINHDQKPDRSSMLPINLGKPSKIIRPEDYIDFTTLPEVIREIIPQTTIRFVKGKYIMRVFDKRAEKYCCRDNPMIFVNNEPYLDISPVMVLPPSIIDYIEVHRALEMIQYFGEVGRNGVVNIILKEGVSHDLPVGQSKQIVQLHGFSKKQTEINTPLPEDYPDFRESLYWNSSISASKSNGFNLSFKTSLLEGSYTIHIVGQIETGELVYKSFEFHNSQ